MPKERRNAGLRLKNAHGNSFLSNLKNFKNIRAFYSNMMEDFKNTTLFRQVMSFYMFLLMIFILIIVYIKLYNINDILQTQTNVIYYSSVVIDLLNMERETKLKLDEINNNDYIALTYSHLYFMKIYSRELVSHDIGNIEYNNQGFSQSDVTFKSESFENIGNIFFDLGKNNKLYFSMNLMLENILKTPDPASEEVLDPNYLIPIFYTFIPVFYQNLDLNGIRLLNFYFLGYKYSNNQCSDDNNVYFKYPIEEHESTGFNLNSAIYDSTLDPVGKCYLSQVKTKDISKVSRTNWYLNYEGDYINNEERKFDTRLIRLLKVGIDSVKNIYISNYVSFKFTSSKGETFVFTFSQKLDKRNSVLPFISYNKYGEAQHDYFSMVNYPDSFGKNYSFDHIIIDISDKVYYKDYNIDDNSTVIMNVPNFINNIYNHAMLPTKLIDEAGSGINDNTLLLTYSEMSKIFDNYSINYFFDLDSLIFRMITFLNNFLQYSNYEKRRIDELKKELNTDTLNQTLIDSLNSQSYHKCSISNLTYWNSKLINDQEYSYDCISDYCFFNNCTSLDKNYETNSYGSRFVPNCYCLPMYCYDPFTLEDQIPEAFKDIYANKETFYKNTNNFYDLESNSLVCRMNFYQKNKKNSPSYYNTHIKLTEAEFKHNTTIFMLYLMEENLLNDEIISRFAKDTSIVRLIVYLVFICVIFVYFILFCKCMQTKIDKLTDRIQKVAVIIKIIFKISGDNDDNFQTNTLGQAGTIMSESHDGNETQKLQEKMDEDFLVNMNSSENSKDVSENISESPLQESSMLFVNLEKELKQLGIMGTDYYEDNISVNQANRMSERYSDELQQFINIIIDNIKDFKIEFSADGNMYESEKILNREFTELITSKYYTDKIFANYTNKNQSFEQSSDAFDLEEYHEKGKLSLNLIYELISTEEMNELNKCVSNFYFKEPKEYSIINFYKWIDTLLYDDTDYINEVTDSEKLKTAINFYVHEIHMQWKNILDEKLKNEERI